MSVEERVAAAWQRIVDVLNEKAPVTARHLRTPADPRCVEQVETEFGQPLPRDLAASLRLVELDEATFEAAIVPPHCLLFDCAGIVSHTQIRERVYGAGSYPARESPVAGDETRGCWPADFRAFVPIATDGGGNTLVVDLRPGSLRGCVMEWYQDGDLRLRWPSTLAMLQGIAEALEHGRPEHRDPSVHELDHHTNAEGGGHPAVFKADGTIEWDWADDWI